MLRSVFVALSARRRPHLAFASDTDMRARLASFVLYIVTATSTFVAGQYFENARQDFIVPDRPATETPAGTEEARAAVAGMLCVWSAVYYTVSLLCFRNSFLLLLARHTYRISSQGGKRVAADHPVRAASMARRCVDFVCKTRKAFVSSRGRYNTHFLVLRITGCKFF